MKDSKYDIIIIGGGPAGLAAGLYCCRSGKRTLLLEGKNIGGQLAAASFIENYPGISEKMSGITLVQNMQTQCVKFGLEIVYEEVESFGKAGKETKIVQAGEHAYQCKAIIVASGVHHRRLDILGEKEFIGKGVSYCATCDGPLYRDQEIAVVGGGNAAAEEALFLTTFARKVFLIHRRDKLRAIKILQDRLFANDKIEIKWNSVVTEIKGDQFVESVIVKNLEKKSVQELKVGGVFIYIGFQPNTIFLKGVVNLDENGYVITGEDMSTSSKGIFACGDCRKKILRQIVTACSDGALAAVQAGKYIDELSHT